MQIDNDKVYSQRNRADLRVLIGGMLGMVVVMGIGRFAYTPILPLMQRDLGMSHTLAGTLAGLNYLGYLIGALLCTFAPHLLRSRLVAVASLGLSLITTIGMGFTSVELWWSLMRLSGGVASALLFIIIAAEVGETLARSGHGHWLGLLYSGIGLGIALSGILVPYFDALGNWSTTWIGMGGVACGGAFLGVVLGRRRINVHSSVPAASKTKGSLRPVWMLGSAYFLEGLGYIVTATFIVTIVATTAGLEPFAPYTWVAVGLAAVPSTIIWPLLARRFGIRRALLAAYTLQAAGIGVSACSTSLAGVMFAAVSFGATFLGIVAMVLSEGKARMGAHAGQAAAFLTAMFSLGQMVGPVVAGWLADIHQDFTLALLLAAGTVMGGALLLVLDSHFITSEKKKG
jgi:MFS family permease